MPAKRYDPSKPTFYLDQSTISDAFHALHLVGRARKSKVGYRPLFQWIERVANEANVCLSHTHIVELAKWGDIATGKALARWLDGLPVVWVHAFLTLIERENAVWTRRAAGVGSSDVEPFAVSVLSALHEVPPPRVIAEVAAAPHAIVYMLDVARADAPRFARAAEMQADAIRANRAWAAEQKWTKERGQADFAAKLRVEVSKRALSADEQLTRDLDPTYAERRCTRAEIPGRLMALYESDPRALPVLRASMLADAGFIEALMRRKAGSAGDRDALSGAIPDRLHLVGAAYCDVFTCDRLTSDSLGDFREGLGRKRELAVGGHADGVEGFVRDLMSTWP